MGGVIRLVTQFDRPSARAVHATPTCGGCCCCCSCCVGAAVASASFTSMSAYFLAADEDESRGRRRSAAALLGAVALPLGIGVAALLLDEGRSLGLAAFALLGLWVVLAFGAYLIAGEHPFDAFVRAGAVLCVGALAGLIEFFIGAASGDGVGYLVVELLLGGVFVYVSYRVARDLSD